MKIITSLSSFPGESSPNVNIFLVLFIVHNFKKAGHKSLWKEKVESA